MTIPNFVYFCNLKKWISKTDEKISHLLIEDKIKDKYTVIKNYSL